MTATIWEHWFKYYVTFKDGEGKTLKTEYFDSIEEAKSEARRWGAFIIVK